MLYPIIISPSISIDDESSQMLPLNNIRSIIYIYIYPLYCCLYPFMSPIIAHDIPFSLLPRWHPHFQIRTSSPYLEQPCPDVASLVSPRLFTGGVDVRGPGAPGATTSPSAVLSTRPGKRLHSELERSTIFHG